MDMTATKQLRYRQIGADIRTVNGNMLYARMTTSEDAHNLSALLNAHSELEAAITATQRRIDELTLALIDIQAQCNNAQELGATGPGFYQDIHATAQSVLFKG